MVHLYIGHKSEKIDPEPFPRVIQRVEVWGASRSIRAVRARVRRRSRQLRVRCLGCDESVHGPSLLQEIAH